MKDGEPGGHDIGRNREIIKDELLKIAKEVSAQVKALYDNRNNYKTDEELEEKMKERAQLIAGLSTRLRAVAGSEIFDKVLQYFDFTSYDAEEALKSGSDFRINVQGINYGHKRGESDALEVLIEELEKTI